MIVISATRLRFLSFFASFIIFLAIYADSDVPATLPMFPSDYKLGSALSVSGGRVAGKNSDVYVVTGQASPVSNSVSPRGNNLHSGWTIPSNIFFSIQISAGANGEIIGDATRSVIAHGEVDNISALPYKGYVFAGWSGDYTGSDNPLTLMNVTKSMNIAANFAREEVALTLAVEGGGAVDPGAGDYQVYSNSAFSVKAISHSGYYFVRWVASGACTIEDSMSAETNVMVNGASKVTAVFNEAPGTAALTISSSPSGAGVVEPAEGVKEVVVGERIAIKAIPAEGNYFTSWVVVGQAAIYDVASPSTSVVLNGNAALKAKFKPIPVVEHTLSMKAGQGGQVTPGVGDHKVADGRPRVITATPMDGYYFKYWSINGGGMIESNKMSSTSVTLIGDASVTANFAKTTQLTKLTFDVSPAGAGFTNPGVGTHTVIQSELLNIGVSANDGYYFVRWQVAGKVLIDDLNSSSTSITPLGEGAVTAVFEKVKTTAVLTLSSNSSDGERGTTNPGAGRYTLAVGQPFSVNALASEGWQFKYWSISQNAVVSYVFEKQTTIEIKGDTTLSAIFKALPPETATMTVASNPADGGVTNPGSYSYTVNVGEKRTLSAEPAAGYAFVSWNVSGKGKVDFPYNPNTTATVLGNSTYTAVFKPMEKVALTIACDPTSCSSSPGVGRYDVNAFEPIPLKAVASGRYHFVNWRSSGGVTMTDVYSENTTVILSGDATVTAIFEENPTEMCSLTIQAATGKGGISPGIGEYSVVPGKQVALVAVAWDGYHFVSWRVTGAADIRDIYDPETSIRLTGNAVVEPVFEEDLEEGDMNLGVAEVEVSNDRIKRVERLGGGGSTNPGIDLYTVVYGSPQRIMAVPDIGYYFVRWETTGNCDIGDVFSAETRVVLYDKYVSVIAYFAKSPEVLLKLTLESDSAVGGTNPGTGAYELAPAQSRSFEAVANNGYYFSRWVLVSGDATIVNDTEPVTRVVMNSQDSVIRAEFEKDRGEGVLTLVAGSGGTTNPGVGEYTVSYGRSTAITAVPDEYFRFSSWTVEGDATVADPNSAATRIVLNNNAAKITANFTNETGVMTMAASPETGGVTTPVTGESEVALNVSKEITATPAEGYYFLKWTSNGVVEFENENSASTTVKLYENATITANFVQQYKVRLTLVVAPVGGGALDPSGTLLVDAGEPLNISATPSAGFAFEGWFAEGNAILEDRMSVSTRITLRGDAMVTAYFSRSDCTAICKVESSSETAGETMPSGENSVACGALVPLMATPYDGSRFVKWEIVGMAKVEDLYSMATYAVIQGDAVITAVFEDSVNVVSMISKPATPVRGGVSISSKIYLNAGETRNIRAMPFAGFAFSRWSVSGDAVVADSYSANTDVTVNGETTLTAEFVSAMAVDSEGRFPRMKLKLDRLADSKDKVWIRKMPFSLTEFDPESDTLSVVVDGVDFSFDPTCFKYREKRRVWRYKSSHGLEPVVTLYLDLGRGEWSFKASRADLSLVDNLNGTDICLKVNDTEYAFCQVLEERDVVRFDAGVSDRAGDENLPVSGVPMSVFTVEKFKSKEDTIRLSRCGVKIKNGEFALPDGYEFNPETDSASLAIGGIEIVVPPTGFTGGKGGRYHYHDRENRLSFSLNFNKGQWSCGIKDIELWNRILSAGKLDIYMTLSGVQGGVRLTPTKNLTDLVYHSRFYNWTKSGILRDAAEIEGSIEQGN